MDKYSSGKKIEVSEEAMNILQQYEWPGNVRELENSIERELVFPDKLSHLKNRKRFDKFVNKIAWEEWYN